MKNTISIQWAWGSNLILPTRPGVSNPTNKNISKKVDPSLSLHIALTLFSNKITTMLTSINKAWKRPLTFICSKELILLFWPMDKQDLEKLILSLATKIKIKKDWLTTSSKMLSILSQRKASTPVVALCRSIRRRSAIWWLDRGYSSEKIAVDNFI